MISAEHELLREDKPATLGMQGYLVGGDLIDALEDVDLSAWSSTASAQPRSWLGVWSGTFRPVRSL